MVGSGTAAVLNGLSRLIRNSYRIVGISGNRTRYPGGIYRFVYEKADICI